MSSTATPLTLGVLWFAAVFVGAADTSNIGREAVSWYRQLQRQSLLSSPFLAVILIAAVVNLVIAIAPSSKIDELYYHMLVPSRIVQEGSLHFYLMPWQSAILPQMTFQIAAAPVYAIGYPDAMNVVSWALSALLLWFAWQLINGNACFPHWTAIWVGSLIVGLYTPVWHVTGGAHALGDLAFCAAVALFCKRESLLKVMTPLEFAAVSSIFTLSAAATKISLLPLSLALLFFSLLGLARRVSPETMQRALLAAAIPWLLFYCPLAVWTWIHSGSPFGPVLAGDLGHSVYPPGWAQEVFRKSREIDQGNYSQLLLNTALSYSLLVWIGASWSLLSESLSKSTRLVLGLLVLMQGAAIYWLLPWDFRYFGGLHFGLLIAFASSAQSSRRRLLSGRRVAFGLAAIGLAPWLCIQVYYARQFVPVSLGIEQPTQFFARKIAFFSDFRMLDALLPREAVLLVTDFTVDSVYMPRPVFFDISDLPKGKKVFWFADPASIKARGHGSDGYKIGEVLYQNSRATIQAYRTPGREPEIGALQVVELIKE
jgi:hypothetical protein